MTRPVADAGRRLDLPRQRRRARAVTYGTIAVLLVVAVVELEAWPLTSYRLFSSVRTGAGSSSSLVAVGHDGSHTTVVIPGDKALLATTAHLYDELARANPERQREMVRAWLGVGGIDPADVASVRLERVRWRMDPESLERVEVERAVTTEVVL